MHTIFLAVFLALGGGAPAQEPNRSPWPFPVSGLTTANQILVRGVLEHQTLRREYTPQRFTGRVEQFEYLLDNMEACSVVAQGLGFIEYRARQDAQGRLVADNREGAQGSLLPVYCAEGRRVFYAEGSYRGILQAWGRGVIIIDFRQMSPETVLYSGRVYVKVDNPVLAVLARMFAAFVRNTVDYYFNHVMRQPTTVSTVAVTCPDSVMQCLFSLPAEDYRLLVPFQLMLPAPDGAATQ